MDEIYDVIDLEGNKIGEATWTEVHTKKLLHQTVAVLIFKDKLKKEVLIQKRSFSMHQHPGLWQHSAGGHILAGDTPDQAILREVQEELFDSQELPSLKLTKVSSFLVADAPNNREILHLYETVYPGPFNHDRGELAEEPRWVSWEELIRDRRVSPDKYSSAFHIILNKYLESKIKG